MSQLLERGAEEGAVDQQGSTPLHLACQYSLMHSEYSVISVRPEYNYCTITSLSFFSSFF